MKSLNNVTTTASFVLFLLGTQGVSIAQSAKLITTFSNPTPATSEYFGVSVAAVGPDHVIVGANFDGTGALHAGSAYLFNTNGTLENTFTNPSPAGLQFFGRSVLGLGSQEILIGGAYSRTQATGWFVYRFGSSGTLLTILTNPVSTGIDSFGWSMAQLGDDRLLIGSPLDSKGPGGAAYLFNSDGTLLTMFTNPIPQADGSFAYSVAALGHDKALIGASRYNPMGISQAGIAYLFTLDGHVVTAFTSPNPHTNDYFGHSLAAVGYDKVLVGAEGSDEIAPSAGIAYLFSTNGALLTTFVNPTHASGAYFGAGVTAVGNDRVLVAAPYQYNSSGVVYIFRTNGTLLATINAPNPEVDDTFGFALATVGSDFVAIGAYGKDTYTGAAYLFSIPPATPPSLAIHPSTTNTIVISWPSPSTGFVLQQKLGLKPGLWNNVTGPIQDDGATKSFVLSADSTTSFFRLAWQ